MKIFLAPNFKASFLGGVFPEELLNLFIDAREQLVCQNVSYWGTSNDSKSGVESNVIANTYPLSWVQKYTLLGFSSVDPVLIECLNSNAVLKLDFSNEASEETKKFFTAVKKAKIGQTSVSVPISLTSSSRSVTTFTFSAVHNKDTIFSPENIIRCREHAHRIASFMHYSDRTSSPPERALTSRETVILNAISMGNSYQEVSNTLNISRWTVIAHAKSARHKLGANTNAEAVRIALEKGILSIHS